MSRFSLLLFFLGFFCFDTFSQDEDSLALESSKPRQYALGITYGFGSLETRDHVISNYLYKGTYKPIGLHFESRTLKRKTFIDLEFLNSPNLFTKTNNGFEYKGQLGEFYPHSTDGYDYSTVKSKMYSLHLSSMYLLRKTQEKKIHAYLGFELSFLSFNKKFLQFEYVNQLTDRVTSLGFVLNLERNFNSKHHIEYNLSIPLFNIAKRSLYNADADPTTVTNKKFTSLGGVLGFDGRLTYRYQVTRGVSFRASYSFQYLQVSFPEKEQWAYGQGLIGLYFHF
jgi:hypothetical protein